MNSYKHQKIAINEQSILHVFYWAIILCFLVTFIFGVFALTIETDESWTLMSAMKVFGIQITTSSSSVYDHAIVTGGGIYVIVHGLVSKFATTIHVHRLVSILFSVVLVYEVYFIISKFLKDKLLALVGSALFLTTPGFLLQASLSTAEIIATTLALSAAIAWSLYGHQSLKAAGLLGVIFGLACATRMTCLAILPAIAIWSFFSHQSNAEKMLRPWFSIAIAFIIFYTCTWIYKFSFGEIGFGDFPGIASGASGLTRQYEGVLFRLSYLTIGDKFLPTSIILATIFLYFYNKKSSNKNNELTSISGFLLLCSLSLYAAWLIRSPIPHLRYLWPALPMFFFSMILLLLQVLQNNLSPTSSRMTHLVVIIFCFIQGLFNVRELAIGDSFMIVLEKAGWVTTQNAKPFFVARNNQILMADNLNKLPPDANVYTFVESWGYPLVYESARSIQALSHINETSHKRYLVLGPWDQGRYSPSWRPIGWISRYSTLVKSFGDYHLYSIQDNTPVMK